jgi:DNA recombination protein RmuC
MALTTILIFSLLIIVLLLVFTLIFKRDKTQGTSELDLVAQLNGIRRELYELQDKNRIELQAQLGLVNERVHRGLNDSQQTIQKQFENSAKIIQEVTEKLTLLDTTNKQVLDFSSQLQSLQDILKNPKHRGIVGEYFLETALKNVLSPEHYKMQYKFSNGEIVDAVITINDKIIPIDSKFSLENYNKLTSENNPTEKDKLEKIFLNDLKTRILETAKYVRPEEGTMDFAFMFIPHEAVYYDLLVNKIGNITDETDSLLARAASKHRVIVVSPTSFFAFLQTVLQGLRGLKIEENAKQILQQVEELGKHMRAYSEYHGKIGKNLSQTVNQFNFSSGELRKLSRDVNKITGSKGDIIDTDVVDRPLIE